MDHLLDNLSRAAASATSRREVLCGMFGVLFGGATLSAMSGCVTSPTAPSSNGCLGSDNRLGRSRLLDAGTPEDGP